MRAFVERYDTDVLHAWGMTEMSPLGTFGTRKGTLKHLAHEEWWRLKVKQGRPTFGVEMKITDDEGHELPHDGKAFGRLKIRGPSIARSYYKGDGAGSFDARTGSTRAMSRHWTSTAIWRSPIAPRTSSSRAASGFHRSTRKRGDRLPGRRGSSGDRLAASQMERAAFAGRRQEAQCRNHARRRAAASHRQGRKMVAAGRCRFRRRNSAHRAGKISKLTLREMFKDFALPAAATAS